MQENTQDMISQEEIDALLSPMTAEEWMDWMKKRHGENKQPLPENLNGRYHRRIFRRFCPER